MDKDMPAQQINTLGNIFGITGIGGVIYDTVATSTEEIKVYTILCSAILVTLGIIFKVAAEFRNYKLYKKQMSDEK